MNDEVVEQKEDQNKQPATKNQVTTGRSLLIWIVGLLAVAASVLATLTYQQNIELRQQTTHLQQAMDKTLDLQGGIDQIEREGRDSRSKLINDLKTIKGKQDSLQDSLNTLYQGRKTTNLDWALAEIEHLLIIASQRLALDADVETAIAAMEAADDRLRDMGQPDLIEIRSQLTRDINALKSVSTVDISGMAIYMADMIQRIDSLPLKDPISAENTRVSADAEQTDPEKPMWQTFLSTVWQELKSLFKISHREGSVTIALLPEQQYYLFQNLGLQLNAARLSILRRDTEGLRTSIDLVLDWLDTYFDSTDAGVINTEDSLRQMLRVDLKPKLPDISSSLEGLRAYGRNKAESSSFIQDGESSTS